MDKKIKEINKKPEKQKVEKDVKKKVVRGSFSTLMIVLVVAIVVVLNIVASFVETDLGLKLDMTSNKIYTLSPLTESIVSQTDEELIIYSFANDNVQDNMIQKTLERYAALSSKISVKVADPAREVALQRKFSTDSVTVSNRTVVLSNKDETLFRVIPYTDMYYTDSENSVTY
ncbi:MAG: Gldg family protein, partial [Firmicutes bacterium]|nr:Gldg family protein [Bacillota bacterium]